jgi:hypothetical protein
LPQLKVLSNKAIGSEKFRPTNQTRVVNRERLATRNQTPTAGVLQKMPGWVMKDIIRLSFVLITKGVSSSGGIKCVRSSLLFL